MIKIKLNKRTLRQKLDIVCRNVAQRTNIDTLKNIYMGIDNDNVITFMSNDLETGVKCNYNLKDVDTSITGSILLPPRIIEIVRHIPSDEVELGINIETKRITITGGNAKFNVTGLDAKEYPTLPKNHPEKQPLTFDSYQLKDIIRKTVNATSPEPFRPAFTGVLFDMQDGNIDVVASDTYRLAWKKVTIDNWAFDLKKILIPNKSLRDLLRLLPEDETTVVVYPSGKQLIFNFNDIYFYTRLLEDKFPNFRNILPESFVTIAEIDRMAFTALVDRALLLSESGHQNANIKIVGLNMEIKAKSEVGFMEENVTLESKEGEDKEIILNLKFLTDFLKVANSNKIIFKLSEKSSDNSLHCIVIPDNDTDYFNLILPIKGE